MSKSIGWISPLGEEQPLAVELQSCLWMSVRIDTKLLPAGVIAEELKEQLVAKEIEQGYPVSNKQKRVLKEEITLDLLPKAFVQSKRFQVVIDPQRALLMIDTTSAQVRDAIVELLRQTVGSCPLVHHQDKRPAIAQQLKQWILDSQAPSSVSIESDCTLIHPNNVNAKVRVVGHELDSPLILSHLESGMAVSQLSINYADQVSFTLNDALEVSKKYLDTNEDSEPTDDPIEKAMADFALWVPYYMQLIEQFKSWFPVADNQPEVVEESEHAV